MKNLTPAELKLIAAIESAFKDVTREDGITLHEALADDNRLSKEEQLEARKLDMDTCWQDIPDEVMQKIEAPFGFLDSKGFRYYLPAYMRFIMKHRDQFAGDMIIYHLVPTSSTQGEKPTWSVKSKVRDLNLNAKQCKVIFDFLKTYQYEQSPEWIGALEEWDKLSK